ncbi:MAG: class II aldolase/adducin family protein [Gammaproteobacteria bacterium]|nr:class II aldolase/adducin family protein [Gammaproteobacteria bacterium]
MSTSALQNIPNNMTETEWQTRVELAACYQLTAMYGWTDMVGTHISARIPGPEDHFLLNPYGMLFEEITASSLIKVDMEGNVIGDSDYPTNPAGFVIHSAIHMHFPELTCVMHTHTPAGCAVGSQEHGLLPLNQHSLLIQDFISYHEFEGAATNLGERERIIRDFGEAHKRILILNNHGLLTVGKSMGEAFMWMYRIEKSCRYQLATMTGGAQLHYPDKATQAHAVEQGRKILAEGGFAECGKKEWPALLRQLERAGSNYAT